MKQREVQDRDGVRWVCVQALGGVDGPVADAAAERLESGGGTVPVVCTPSGGDVTVRVALEPGWEEAASDATLLAAIGARRT